MVKSTSDNTVKWITQMSEKTGVELDRCRIRQVSIKTGFTVR